MRNKILYLAAIISAVVFTSWKMARKDYEKEIRDAEKSFEKTVYEKGMAEAFYAFADDNAVIKRQNDTLVKGKENIRKFYQKQNAKNFSLTWAPEFIGVSQGGDLAYTYGKYIWKSKNDKGEEKTYTGVFHTVWKRQKDGSWKYVWD